MCGIAGIISTDRRDHSAVMREMRALIVHRGPDAEGEHIDAYASLGVQRLRIIDLVTGDQPQANEDGTVWTVFNGEIYNFRELREELTAHGHRLVTASSDTEVIVHLYEEHGDRFAERLDGMFALAVWDARRRTLVLARDRQGKKPLLYHEFGGRIAFASEHAALLRGISERPRVSPEAIRLYLRLGYVPAPFDAFDGIRKLPPGHVLVWRDGQSAVRQYWTPPEPGTLRIGEADAVSELLRLLERAVVRRLVADVPVGAFLSGGVDSSGVVAMMARNSSKVRTFSIGFAEAQYSELAHARRIASLYGTDHHEFIIGPGELDVLPLLVRHYGEPFADSSALPTYHLSKLTREHVTVALNGDGGDELFAGYDRYLAVRLASYLDAVPRVLRAGGAGLMARLLPDSISPLDPLRRTRRFLLAAALPVRERYLRWLSVFDASQLAPLLDSAFADPTAHAEQNGVLHLDVLDRPDPVAAAQELDRRLYLPDDLLVKVDIASMANSLEVRSPLLDTALVEFAIRLPTDLKLRGTTRKYVLKRALAGLVPAQNMRRRKQGFAVPIGSWFRDDLRTYIEEIVLSPRARARGYFRPAALEALVREHTSGAVDHTHRVWSLLMLELWHREFVDVASPAPVR